MFSPLVCAVARPVACSHHWSVLSPGRLHVFTTGLFCRQADCMFSPLVCSVARPIACFHHWYVLSPGRLHVFTIGMFCRQTDCMFSPLVCSVARPIACFHHWSVMSPGRFFTQFDEQLATSFSVFCGIAITHSLLYNKVADAHARIKLSNELMMLHMNVSNNIILQILKSYFFFDVIISSVSKCVFDHAFFLTRTYDNRYNFKYGIHITFIIKQVLISV